MKKTEFPTARYEAEIGRFDLLCGDKKIRSIGFRIATKGWFSWRELYSSMRRLPVSVRPVAWKYIRVAQKERATTYVDEFTARWKALKRDILKFMVCPVSPLVYDTGMAPIMLNGARIGVTLGSERMRGNQVRIYYKSAFDFGLEIVSIEKAVRDADLWKSLGEEPAVSAVYHVRIQKSVAVGAA